MYQKNTPLDLSTVSKMFCVWDWKVLETFQTYRFQKSGLKEYTFRKKKATENGIGLEEYILKAYLRTYSFGTFSFQQTVFCVWQASKSCSFGSVFQKRSV